MERAFSRLVDPFRKPKKDRRKRQKRGLRFQSLENRNLFAAAVLDFDGEWITRSHFEEGGWSDQSSRYFSSFQSLFRSSQTWMDTDGNGTVNRADADLAIEQITDKVREHYAPYNISILVGDQDTHQYRLTDRYKGDAIVMVTGGTDFRGEDALGRSPEDALGNENDEFAFVFGREHLNFNDIEQFTTQVAVTISHELGHALGLRHISDTTRNNASYGGAARNHIMFAGVGDSSRNSNFQDITYDVSGGIRQNAHQYLTETLGESYKPWAAVLKPGQLTIDGSYRKDVMSVYPASFSDDWIVSIRYEDRYLRWKTQSYRVDPGDSPGMDSLNPFSRSIYVIHMWGENGDDYLSVSRSLSVQSRQYGGWGDDTLSGGSGRDYLYGHQGHDYLYGNGGYDWLQGGSGNDYLDGGHDHIRDTVYGQSGADTFVYHVHRDESAWLGLRLEDDLRDVNFAEDSWQLRYWET